MTEFDDAPPTGTATAATVTAALATLAVATITPGAAALAAVGVALLAYGAFDGHRGVVTAGASTVFVANLFGAFAAVSAPVLPTLVAGALAVAAWDLGEHGIGLGEHVGADARTRNAELVHAALTLAVAAVAVAAGYAVYLAGADGRPLAAVVLLAAGALVLFRALR